MDEFSAVLGKQTDTMNQITGGNQFCYLSPMIFYSSDKNIRLARANSGQLPLEVCNVDIYQSPKPVTGPNDFYMDYLKFVLRQKLGPVPPGTNEFMGTDIVVPVGHYCIRIFTRNDQFFELLNIHPEDKNSAYDGKILNTKGQVVKKLPK
jgi:hypothetical protein